MTDKESQGSRDLSPEEELEMLAKQPTLAQRRATDEEITMRIFRDNAPVAAEVIAHLSINGEKESTRLNASRYIVDRVLGRIPDNTAGATAGNDVLTELFGSVTREPSAEERASGARVSRL